MFPGVPIADLDAGHKTLARTLVERIVANYVALPPSSRSIGAKAARALPFRRAALLLLHDIQRVAPRETTHLTDGRAMELGLEAQRWARQQKQKRAKAK